jgi:hypothetical protein
VSDLLPTRRFGWERLFRIARSLIDQVNAEYPVIEYWTFGGGSALMLQIGHRESHDVDLFLRDAQLLPFLNPATRSFTFETAPDDYGGDGTGFLKLAFDDGEIDFIVAGELTENPVLLKEVGGRPRRVETVPEIIAKKIVHRGTSIKPRDIFDIAAAADTGAEELVSAIRPYADAVARTIESIDRLNPEFVSGAIAELMIKDRYRYMAATAVQRALEVLEAV